MSESSSDEQPHSPRYITVPKAMQLISKPFSGNPVELREFIQNVESAYEIVDPSQHSLLFKFVCAKIRGEAKTKLLSRTHIYTWEQVKTVLEENYSVRRTLDYYAHRAFTSKQNQTETISQWGARMDIVCGDLQRAARKHMEDLTWTSEKCEGGGDIIDLFIRACFIQGLHDDRIKTMVKAKGNVNTPMAQLVEVALEEESSIRSERFRHDNERAGQFRNQERPKKMSEHRDVRAATVRCHRCNRLGHYAHRCRALPLSGGEATERKGSVTKDHDYRNTQGNGQRGCLANQR